MSALLALLKTWKWIQGRQHCTPGADQYRGRC